MYSPMFFASISPRNVTSAAGDCAVTVAIATRTTASTPACTSRFIRAPFVLSATLRSRVYRERDMAAPRVVPGGRVEHHRRRECPGQSGRPRRAVLHDQAVARRSTAGILLSHHVD